MFLIFKNFSKFIVTSHFEKAVIKREKRSDSRKTFNQPKKVSYDPSKLDYISKIHVINKELVRFAPSAPS